MQTGADGGPTTDATDAAAAAGLRALAAAGERHRGLETRATIDVLAASLVGAGLTPLGWVAAVNELAYAVNVQRKVDAELALAPSLGALRKPVVVSGLPRSGVAHLHHLLALSPSLYAPREWEVASPTARAESQRTGDEEAVREAMRLGRVRIELLEVVAPRLPELTPMSSHTGEGCTQLLHHTLCSLQLLMMFRAREYAAWLCTQDLRPVYGFWADQLRLLQPESGVCMLGASPFHTLGYEALWSVADDATVVHVRRDPVEAFEAFVDVAVSVRMAFSEQVDPPAVAAEWLELWTTMLQRAVTAARGRRDQLVAVDEDQVRREPRAMVALLCDRLAIEAPPPRDVAAMAAVLDERQRGRRVAIDAVGLRRSEVAAALRPLQQQLDEAAEPLR